jgi:hypothetical protein
VENFLPDFAMAVLLSVGGGGLLWLVSRKMGISSVPFVVVVPALILVGLGLYLPVSPFYLPSDGGYYQQWGYGLSNSWAGGPALLDRPLWPGKGFWPLIIAIFHSVVGPVTITLIVFNAVVFGGMVLCLQKSVVLLTGQNTRWFMVFVMLSSTPFVLFGPSLLRESIFWLGMSGGVLALAYMLRDRIRLAVASASWGALLLLVARPDAGVVIAYAFVGVIVVLLGFLGPIRSVVRGAAAVAILGALVISAPFAFDFVRGGADAGLIDRTAQELSAPDVETGFSGPPDRNDPAPDEARQSFCEDVLVVKVACDGLRNLPYVFFGPFYWEYGPEAIWIIAGLSTLHFLLLVGLATIYLLSKEGRHWVTAGALCVAAVSLIMFASILSNYGILIRFRAATEVILVPFAIAGYFIFVAKLKTLRPRTVETPLRGAAH